MLEIVSFGKGIGHAPTHPKLNGVSIRLELNSEVYRSRVVHIQRLVSTPGDFLRPIEHYFYVIHNIPIF